MAQEKDRLIGEAPAFLQVLEEVSRVAPLNKPVLVVGERGTGKELIASRLHYLSDRWEAEYLKLNCAAINDSLLESELFGHEAGSFTGAIKAHKGRFERANGGTLFLDELATTSVLIQEKLLRVIEYGEFERVGGNKTLISNARLVAATNEDLPTLAKMGRFRLDLLDRLAFDVITLPPLRERLEDIPLLADHFAINMASELEREFFSGFTEEASEILLQYPWPGNVRELKNVVERAVYRNDPDYPIDEIILDPFASPYRPKSVPQNGATVEVEQKTPSSTSEINFPLDLKDNIKNAEIEIIQAALEQAKHNQRKAAELLALTYHQLRGYLKKYELLPGNEEAETDT